MRTWFGLDGLGPLVPKAPPVPCHWCGVMREHKLRVGYTRDSIYIVADEPPDLCGWCDDR